MTRQEKLTTANELIREVIGEDEDYDKSRFKPGDIGFARESGEEAGQLRSAATLISDVIRKTWPVKKVG